jgi:hypothetical protein
LSDLGVQKYGEIGPATCEPMALALSSDILFFVMQSESTASIARFDD